MQCVTGVAHGYFKVDFELVWKTIHEDLPELHGQVSQLIANLTMLPSSLEPND